MRGADHVPVPVRQRRVDVDRREQAQLDLEMRRQARLERDPEPGAGGLLDRPVRAERADRRVEVVGGQELLGHRACSRPLLAQQPRPRAELLDAHPPTFRERVVGRCDDDDRVVEESLGRERIIGRPTTDRDVRPMRPQALEHALAVAHVDGERDLRMVRVEGLHELRRDVLAGGRHGADPQLRSRPVRGLTRRPGALIQQADDVGRVRREHPARGARTHVATDALCQVDSQLAPERGDGGRHRRLRDDQLVGCRGHRPRPDDGQEAAKLSDGYSHMPNGSAGA